MFGICWLSGFGYEQEAFPLVPSNVPCVVFELCVCCCLLFVVCLLFVLVCFGLFVCLFVCWIMSHADGKVCYF